MSAPQRASITLKKATLWGFFIFVGLELFVLGWQLVSDDDHTSVGWLLPEIWIGRLLTTVGAAVVVLFLGWLAARALTMRQEWREGAPVSARPRGVSPGWTFLGLAALGLTFYAAAEFYKAVNALLGRGLKLTIGENAYVTGYTQGRYSNSAKASGPAGDVVLNGGSGADGEVYGVYHSKQAWLMGPSGALLVVFMFLTILVCLVGAYYLLRREYANFSELRSWKTNQGTRQKVDLLSVFTVLLALVVMVGGYSWEKAKNVEAANFIETPAVLSSLGLGSPLRVTPNDGMLPLGMGAAPYSATSKVVPMSPEGESTYSVRATFISYLSEEDAKKAYSAIIDETKRTWDTENSSEVLSSEDLWGTWSNRSEELTLLERKGEKLLHVYVTSYGDIPLEATLKDATPLLEGFFSVSDETLNRETPWWG